MDHIASLRTYAPSAASKNGIVYKTRWPTSSMIFSGELQVPTPSPTEEVPTQYPIWFWLKPSQQPTFSPTEEGYPTNDPTNDSTIEPSGDHPTLGVFRTNGPTYDRTNGPTVSRTHGPTPQTLTNAPTDPRTHGPTPQTVTLTPTELRTYGPTPQTVTLAPTEEFKTFPPTPAPSYTSLLLASQVVSGVEYSDVEKNYDSFVNIFDQTIVGVLQDSEITYNDVNVLSVKTPDDTESSHVVVDYSVNAYNATGYSDDVSALSGVSNEMSVAVKNGEFTATFRSIAAQYDISNFESANFSLITFAGTPTLYPTFIPTTSPSTATVSDSGIDVGLIVGLVVGGLFIILVPIVAVLVYRYYNKGGNNVL